MGEVAHFGQFSGQISDLLLVAAGVELVGVEIEGRFIAFEHHYNRRGSSNTIVLQQIRRVVVLLMMIDMWYGILMRSSAAAVVVAVVEALVIVVLRVEFFDGLALADLVVKG